MSRTFYTAKQKHIAKFLNNARCRAIARDLAFDLTFTYLESIATDECPVFKTPFIWGNVGHGRRHRYSECPNLDRVSPEKGYIIGNVAFLSARANRIKDNGTMEEHYKIADWIWEHKHAKQK